MPFTLSHLFLDGKDQCFNFVQPYPTLEKNVIDDHRSIINAIDMYMGQNGILWVLDAGVVNTLEEIPKKESEPRVFGINYGTGQVCNTSTSVCT